MKSFDRTNKHMTPEIESILRAVAVLHAILKSDMDDGEVIMRVPSAATAFMGLPATPALTVGHVREAKRIVDVLDALGGIEETVTDRNIRDVLKSREIMLKALQKIEGDFIPDNPSQEALALSEMRECAGEAISDAHTAWPGEDWKRVACE